jgi:hypothetical protein
MEFPRGRVRSAVVFHIRDTKVDRLVVYSDGDRVANFGLDQEADSPNS